MQILKKIKYIFILIAAFGFAEEDALMIDSCSAHYDGSLVILSGSVKVEQKLGKIYAGHMILTPENGRSKMRFSHLNMQDDVKIELKDGGQLLCAKADLDYLTGIGSFSGNASQEYVIYTENCTGKEDKKFPVLVKSRKMNIELVRQEKNSFSQQVSKIKAQQNVTINYNHDFIATSEQADYQRLESEEEGEMPGHIRLFSQNLESLCQITNKNGDLVRSHVIDLDTAKQNLQFSAPSGFLSIDSKENRKEKIHFESDSLNWDNKQNVLTFSGNVAIRQKDYGDLQGSQQVKLHYTEDAKKKKIKQIESLGETILAHIDEDKKLVHTLTAYGKVLVDHVHLKTIIESPRDEKGDVIEGMQIYFNDILGEIYADSAVLDYQEKEGTVSIEKLLLEGNVRILNRSSVNPEESEAFLQYALADFVEFFPSSQEMLMSADKTVSLNQRVLFYDKANSLQVSAPAVKVRRDAITKRESIQGIGDVRFSLDGQELEKLRSHFSLEPVKGV
ncbi:MAG TPA: LptA/OstA family protein [Parachlamydiaceae bacterium]|nr:LptA/OstA family protein [Parachlamydiaceae bacterium]